MSVLFRLACPGCLFCLVLPSFAQEGRLGQVREEVRQPEPFLHETRQDRQTATSRDDNDTPLGWLLTTLFAPEPDAATHVQIGESAAPYYSPRYPYRRGYPGFLTVHPDSQPEVAEYWQGAPMKTWWGTVGVDGGYLDDLSRVGVRARIDSTSRLGLTTSWDHYHENLGRGRSDDLNIGDLNGTFRFWQSHWGQAHAGVGFRWLSDQRDTDFGVNFQASADFFPVRPVVFSLLTDFGTLGDAAVFHFRATVGVVHKHFEVFGGFDHLSIGRVDLDGPLVGLRLWF